MDSRLSAGRGSRRIPASIPLSKLPFAVGAVRPSPYFARVSKIGNNWRFEEPCARHAFPFMCFTISSKSFS